MTQEQIEKWVREHNPRSRYGRGRESHAKYDARIAEMCAQADIEQIIARHEAEENAPLTDDDRDLIAENSWR